MFYKINAIINHGSAPRKILMEGLFITKSDECTGIKIRIQCEEFIRKHVRIKAKTKAEKEQMRKELVIKITYKKLPDDFVVMEDKE